jgi:hypothetical protein
MKGTVRVVIAYVGQVAVLVEGIFNEPVAVGDQEFRGSGQFELLG